METSPSKRWRNGWPFDRLRANGWDGGGWSVRAELTSVWPELISVRAESISARPELISARAELIFIRAELISVRAEPVEALMRTQGEEIGWLACSLLGFVRTLAPRQRGLIYRVARRAGDVGTQAHGGFQG